MHLLCVRCAAQLGTAHPYTPACAFWDCAHRSPPDWAHTRPHLHLDQVHPPPTSAPGSSRSLTPLCTAKESIPGGPHLHRNRINPPPTSVSPLLPSGTSASARHKRGAAAQHTVLQPRALCCNRVPPVPNPAADGACCNRLLRCRAAGCTRSERGVCAAQWTRIGFDVSAAVPLTAPSIPSAGRVRATGSEDSVDARVASFGSEQSRPTSALGLCLRVGQRTRAQHGPTVLLWFPRGDGAWKSVEPGPYLLLGRAARADPWHWCDGAP